MKIYCRGYRWKRLGVEDFMLFTRRCHHPKNTIVNDTPMRAGHIHLKIWHANKGNYCKLFEKK